MTGTHATPASGSPGHGDPAWGHAAPGGSRYGAFPAARPRRLRSTAALRRMVTEHRTHPSDLILPAFVREGITEPVPVSSMPGVLQHTRDTLRKAAADAVAAGVGGIMLFGVPEHKDATGSQGTDPEGILQRALRDVRAEVGDDLVVMSDLCLDEFTDHGHCGVLDAHGRVDNDATLERYAEMALRQAEAGAHVLGPSGMMDGQVGYVRRALDAAGHTDVAMFAYTVKYASAFYGPFREAVNSSLTGDRKTYQQDPAGGRGEALRELALDLAEGADMVMVKPGLPYLDVLRDIARAADVPVGVYQISGEYAMVEAAAQKGWIERERAILETLTSFTRAGASLILTYWATEAARWLHPSR
ncbi:porphobilinogen synthase [Streptomyces sp. JJ66]|uniref:porphobilinogen synthase n=1 Tax=Streptomyces sp. JJ66 TaxID=2803843 RepID=UPI001C5691A7|nr:porphobilinogen synthase [Streptomyces sp. JJ66]MBW1602642.1 porphobilinogen synthase [Streptomyces sp. JJ66]